MDSLETIKSSCDYKSGVQKFNGVCFKEVANIPKTRSVAVKQIRQAVITGEGRAGCRVESRPG
jgi:hypothetical protein